MSATTSSNRRDFLRKTTTGAGALAATAFSTPMIQRALGANDKIRVGFLGVGNRGTQLLHSFMRQPDVEVAALNDVYLPYLHRDRSQVDRDMLEALGGRVPMMGEEISESVPRYQDFRRVLEMNDVDAVVISTPDHWHAIQTIQACEAGKDVYVEKPLSITIVEGRKMVEAAERMNRVVQVGLQRRSSTGYRQASELTREGRIGKVSVARSYRVSNMYPHGIGRRGDAAPPEGLDWDLWLGPRPERSFRENIPLYMFRWWEAYSSQVANWGVHYFDCMLWALGASAPISVSAHGGRFALDDDRTVPDTMEVIAELEQGCLMTFCQYEASGINVLPMGDVELRGTLANLYMGVRSSGYRVVPSHGGQFQENVPYAEPEEADDLDGNLDDQHARNFLDCVKSREKPNCDLETGHRSTTVAHLANIALATRSRLEWDAVNERVLDNDAANELLHYEYRTPWTLG